MGNVNFYAMSFNWQAIKTIRAKADFRAIIFQPENDDKSTHPRKRADYILTAFEIYAPGSDPVEISDPAILSPDAYNVSHNKKVKFGNLPFTKALIDEFINYESQNPGKVITSLLIVPNKKNTQGKFKDYVTYKIKTQEQQNTVNKKMKILAHEEDLNPSPPAPPPL